MRLAVLGSTRGTHLTTIQNAIISRKLTATISIVVSNKKEAGILERAHSLNLMAYYLPVIEDRTEYDEKMTTLLQMHAVDYIVLIGYMRILSSVFVSRWQNKIINVHPSLLPRHAGKMDLAVHEAVLLARERESGCTVHYVNEVVDGGPILLQKTCLVATNETPLSLKQRVQQLEGEALVEALIKLSA